MLNKSLSFMCPVCGYPDLNEAPYDSFGCATYSICPCCGTEFGYDDSEVSHSVLREKWVNGGMKWWSEYLPSSTNWNPVRQLEEAGLASGK
ncbi:hypothetical protein EJI01_21390 [Variovorax sp. MHTC-1]|nr:hypothetical protein EJI01_21390 [Variovorax sp. MHTC-1]